MTLLVAGLVFFLGVHTLPMLQAARGRLVTAWGERRYKGTYSVLALIGIVLIVLGWRAAGPGPQLFAASELAIRIAPYAMVVVFILFASSHGPSHIRATVRHPMLIGLLVWALVHLCANGDLRGTLLFGAFLAYAAIDLVSVIRRGAVAVFEPRLRADVIAVVAGTIVALLVMTFHRVLFGPAVVPFSV
ncbi:MAG TPA: NnrU family protein [Casimicrobiaceae bacterium]|jgi:uncharacterized membrane protein